MLYNGSCFISSSSKLRLFHGEGKGEHRSLAKFLCFQHDKALLVCSAAVLRWVGMIRSLLNMHFVLLMSSLPDAAFDSSIHFSSLSLFLSPFAS